MNRPYEREPGSIACVKLVSGEMILGRIIRSDDSSYFVVEKPVLLQLVPTADGKGFGHAMIPYMGDEATIRESAIIAECPEQAVDRNAMSRYIQAVTGIQTAKSMPGAKGGV